ncbi:MAG: hypothetical protein RIT45_941 [Pseudomonadota bacterium]
MARASVDATWQRGTALADAARRAFWRPIVRLSIGRRAVVDRELRLALLAFAHGGVALTLAVVAPLWLLLLGPLLLGVPHVAGDLRYLVLEPRRPWRRAGLLGVGALLAAMTLHRGALALGWDPAGALGTSALRLELLLGGLAVVAAGGYGAVGPARRRMGVVAAGVALTVALWSFPMAGFIAFSHLHNAIGAGIWLAVAHDAPRGRARWAVAGCWLGAQVALLAGVFDGITAAVGGYWAPASGMDFGALELQLAPGLDAPWAGRGVQAFAFAQSVHYLVWTRLMPQQCDSRAAPSTFRADVRRGRAVFGRWGFGLVALAAVGLPMLALVIGARARDGYLHAIAFHGWLELAALSAWSVAARPRRTTAGQPAAPDGAFSRAVRRR